MYLTPDAELIGQGLSGTIDVHTIDPLKYDSRKQYQVGRIDHRRPGGGAGAEGLTNLLSFQFR